MKEQSRPAIRRFAAGVLAAALLASLAGCGAAAPAAAQADPTAAPAASPTPTPSPTPDPAAVASSIAAQQQAEQEAARAASDEALAALVEYLESCEGSVSVSCIRLSDGYGFAYNADLPYYAASLLKAPYALWLCQRAEAGELDLNTPLPAYGTAPAQTAADALHDMIAYSDNDATEQLFTLWPAEAYGPFAEFLLTLGVDRPDDALTVETSIHGVLNAADMQNIQLALYDYFETGTAAALLLEQAFLDADHPMLESEWQMAKKYGNWDGALHDTAIVYSDDPYCVAVMSSWGAAEEDFPEPGTSQITEIGDLVADLMAFGLPDEDDGWDDDDSLDDDGSLDDDDSWDGVPEDDLPEE